MSNNSAPIPPVCTLSSMSGPSGPSMCKPPVPETPMYKRYKCFRPAKASCKNAACGECCEKVEGFTIECSVHRQAAGMHNNYCFTRVYICIAIKQAQKVRKQQLKEPHCVDKVQHNENLSTKTSVVFLTPDSSLPASCQVCIN